MMNKRTAFLIVLFLCGSAFAADLQKDLDAMVANHKGKVALFAKNLKTGDMVAIQADRPVQTASVIKLAIMVEAFTQVKGGKIKLDDRVELKKDDQVIGSGVLQAFDSGLRPTIRDLIMLMIDYSDNTATNMVIDQVGIPAVNQRIAAIGLKNTYLYKKVFRPPEGPMPADQKEFGLGKTTAREMAMIMESIERCDLGDQDLCKQMIGILKKQHYRDMIPRYIQTSDTTERPSAIANKTGALDAVRNDVAIVYTKAGPIVISIFTWDNEDKRWTVENPNEVLVGRMAQRVMEEWAKKSGN